MDPIFYKGEILEFPESEALKIASEISFACLVDCEEPDAAYESISDLEFEKAIFDEFMAEYIANESISTTWGHLINYEKEIKMLGNEMAKVAGDGIDLLPGEQGFSHSPPKKKDGQYYTRVTFAFTDGQAVRILFYNPDAPEEKHTYPSKLVSFQIFLNKKDITPHLVKGGGKDYGPRKFGKIIGNLLKKNSEKFQQKNAEIKAQKEELEKLDTELSSLDEQISSISSEVTQAKERNAFLKKQYADLKTKAEEVQYKKEAKEYTAPDGKKHNIPQTDNQPGSNHLVFWRKKDALVWSYADPKKSDLDSLMKLVSKEGDVYTWINKSDYSNQSPDSPRIPIIYKKESAEEKRQKEIEDSKTETEAGTSWYNGQYLNFKGKKADEVTDTNDIVKAIRDDIKEAQKSGDILDAGGRIYSVRKGMATHTPTIDVELKALPEGVELYSDEWKAYLRSGDDDKRPVNAKRYSKKVRDTLDKLETIINQYQRSETDGMTDYYNQRFFSSVGVSYDLQEAEREKVKAQVQTDNKVEETHDRDELKNLLIGEFNQLKAEEDTPEFRMGLKVAKMKGNKAGKITIDIKEADVSNLDELNELKDKLEAIVKSHTDNYEILTNKAEALIGDQGGEDQITDIAQQINKAYLSLSGGKWNKRIRLAELRKELPDIPRDQLDNELIIQAKSRNIVLYSFDDPNEVTEADKEAFLDYGGEKMGIIYILKALSQEAEPEPGQQEQVADTDIKQTDIPQEEEPENKREIGSEYKDSNGVTKLITHEFDGKKVSATIEQGYQHSAYLKFGEWRNLPVEERTLVSEDDLKKAIARNEQAYQTADDILTGKYDDQGHEKVDQLIDQVSESIEEDSKLMELAKYYTDLLTKAFTVNHESVTT